jgi:hypothetical protein
MAYDTKWDEPKGRRRPVELWQREPGEEKAGSYDQSEFRHDWSAYRLMGNTIAAGMHQSSLASASKQCQLCLWTNGALANALPAFLVVPPPLRFELKIKEGNADNPPDSKGREKEAGYRVLYVVVSAVDDRDAFEREIINA